MSQVGAERGPSPGESVIGDAGFGPPRPDEVHFPFPQETGRISPAMSIAISVGNMSGSSRFPSNVHKYYFRLKQAVMVVQEDNAEKGAKLLALNLKELQSARKDLDSACDQAESQGDFPEEIRGELEAAVELLPQMEREVAASQDRLECAEKLQRVKLAQRPRTKFSDFHGFPEE